MFQVNFSSPETFKINFSGGENFEAGWENTIEVPVGETYQGSYDITPTDEDQTLQIDGMVAARNIVIRAVPNQQYGHIAWDGSGLTIY